MTSTTPTLLVAHRGEIAVRVLRAARELGWGTMAVHAEDDAGAGHLRHADRVVPLHGIGPAAYLDGQQLVEIALAHGAGVVHPGYGFLAERADFAQRCADAGLVFAGPSPDVLARLGDKVAARALAAECGVPVASGSSGVIDLDGARTFQAGHGGSVVLKAAAGGGGRGMRIVSDPAELEAAFERCAGEALAAFGNASLYVEELLPRARHVEVQVVGDGTAVTHLGERDCTLQRRHQKLVELAPAPFLDPAVRDGLTAAALSMAVAVGYRGVGTFEFLVTPDRWVFLEANPRLQVEHTVTEEVTGIDLVHTQLRLATGARLADLDLGDTPPVPRGAAIQLRLMAERVQPDASALPAGGTLERFDLPGGLGVRVDTAAAPGWQPNPRFDPLLAKLVVRSGSEHLGDLLARARRALAETVVEGVDTNAGPNWRRGTCTPASSRSTRRNSRPLCRRACRCRPSTWSLRCRAPWSQWT
jgi:acetyl/propionyl-CoA carboxylase alpha subunit